MNNFWGRAFGKEQRLTDDEYLLETIARLKEQTEELRQILYNRQSRMDQMKKNDNTVILKIAESLNSISVKIDQAESTITDTIENNQELIYESIHSSIEDGLALANKPMEEAYKKIADELQENIESFKFEIASSSDKIEEMKNTVDSLQKILEDKADKAPVVSLHQRFTTMFAVSVVSLVGTMMTLGLLCYLIISIAR